MKLGLYLFRDYVWSFLCGIWFSTMTCLLFFAIGILDTARVADDLGQTRFQFKIFHKPLLVWKGSYYVTNYTTEKQVGYEKVIASGANEDQYFSVIAARLGHTFDFVEGEAVGHSAGSLPEHIAQRKRFLQASLTIAGSHANPLGSIQHWASRYAAFKDWLLVDWLIDWLDDSSIDLLDDRLIDWLIDWSIHLLIFWTIDWLIDQPASLLINDDKCWL